ncbi:putative cell survival pathways protein [Orbilia javanica]|uniref:Cell survival pathways protein n=1 Tax=Orbilia javanica TaxID=47235 RepID=A0AAN8MXA9_9PEZI
MFKWAQAAVANVAGTAEPEYGPEAIKTVHQHSEADANKPLYTETTSKDLAWAISTSTNVETQVFYITTDDGRMGMAQVIYSVVVPGVKTTSQFNIKLFDPKKPEEKFWSSVPLTNPSFHGPKPSSDGSKAEAPVEDYKTSFYADNVAITLSEDGGVYKVKSQADPNAFCNLVFTRLAPGFMAGKDGRSTYGTDQTKPWGEIRHAFWPRCKVEGVFVINGETVKVDGSGLFIHALQNMKPHHAAARWNFANFQGPTVSANFMEFTTPPSYGSTRVAVGGIAMDGEIISASGLPENLAEHVSSNEDPEARWPEPKDVKFTWKGKNKDGKDVVAVIETTWPQRMDRVDIMSEVPGFVKSIVSAAAGTRPYIYQFFERVSLKVKVGDNETTEEGWVFSEATFIS